MAQFAPGQRVNRIEDREVTGAIILSVEDGPDGRTYHIEYDEGATATGLRRPWRLPRRAKTL